MLVLLYVLCINKYIKYPIIQCRLTQIIYKIFTAFMVIISEMILYQFPPLMQM